MTRMVVEVRRGDGPWRVAGQHSPGDSGSCSSEEPRGRQVYVFGWVKGDGPAVWRSIGGMDSEIGALRHTTTLGLEQLADLNKGPFELPVIHPRLGAVTFRFRLAS